MGYPSVEAQGTMTSVYNLGCFGGALSTLYTGDKLGRPRSLIVGSLIIALGAIIQATVYGPTQMYVGRVVAGKTWSLSVDGLCVCPSTDIRHGHM